MLEAMRVMNLKNKIRKILKEEAAAWCYQIEDDRKMKELTR